MTIIATVTATRPTRTRRIVSSEIKIPKKIVENPVGVHDLQATILHLLGLDPHTLRYPFQGLDQRLIGPAEGPRVIHDLFS